ncbi:MAG: hypothetical protein GKR90_13410 [Pseudomonadales bacterium]|nr:hypothetical protein [Pseudomonadales bacterium]
MKKLAVNCLLVATLLLASQPVFSQGSLFTHSTPAAVYLRWNAPLGEAFEGFHIERQTNQDGNWQRVTNELIVPIQDVGQIQALMGAQADSFLAFFGDGLVTISASQFRDVMSDPVARGFIQFFSVQNPNMGYVLAERYVDRDVEQENTVQYRVQIRRNGDETLWAESSLLTPSSSQQVPVPRDLSGEGDESVARLNWRHDETTSSSGNSVAYRVYRSDTPSGPFTPASLEPVIPTKVNGGTPDYLYIDRYLNNGQPYWYRVSALNVLGFEGAQSTAIKIIPKDTRRPPTPMDLIAELQSEGVFLRWTPIISSDLEGYRIYRGDTPQGDYGPVWPESDQPLTPKISRIEPLSEGQEFWYYVVAVDLAGNESLPSDRVQVFKPDATPPEPVQNLVAIAGDREPVGIHLTWQANNESDLQGYLVHRTTRIADDVVDESKFFTQNVDPLTEPAYLDPVPPISQTKYAYRVIAVDNAGNYSESSEVVVARMPDTVAPTAPALRYVRMDSGAVQITWQANGEPDLEGYRLYRSLDDKQFAPVGSIVVGQDTSDNPPDLNTIYHYHLTALDESGNESDPSQSLSVMNRDNEPPNAPDVTAIHAPKEGLEIEWTSVPGDVDLLILYRGVEDAEPDVFAYLYEREQRYLDVDVDSDKSYQYYLRATDAAENFSTPGKSMKYSP